MLRELMLEREKRFDCSTRGSISGRIIFTFLKE